MARLITILTPVYNEEATVVRCYEEVRRVMTGLGPDYDYEHVFGDNCSRDGTLKILRGLAAQDPRVKVLTYSRNFGAEPSVVTLLRHASGDACIIVCSDLQDPPDLIPTFVAKWAEGYEIVNGIYTNHSDTMMFRLLRKTYYRIVKRLSGDELEADFSGYGLLDRQVVDVIKEVDDHAPYTRGLISSVGFNKTNVPYVRPPRAQGESKHGLAFLFGYGINALISYSIIPIRLATFVGLFLSCSSLLLALGYAILKMIKWNIQAPGATTTIVLVLFFSGIQLFFLGILGEYIGAIHGQVRRKPFVVVRERINFGPRKD